jgi:hypothetical protein
LISLTSITGKNEDLIPVVLNIYAKDGDTIADVTYGKGNFWKKVDLVRYDFYPSDIKTNGYDFKNLPYEDNIFDIVAFDPPYMHGSPAPINDEFDKTYLNNEKGGWGYKYVYSLYLDGMKESWRILKQSGILLVKCQDQIESGKNYFDHIIIYDMAKEMGYIAEDLFILSRNQIPMMRHKYQLHARKNHSYLWVFRKSK